MTTKRERFLAGMDMLDNMTSDDFRKLLVQSGADDSWFQPVEVDATKTINDIDTDDIPDLLQRPETDTLETTQERDR